MIEISEIEGTICEFGQCVEREGILLVVVGPTSKILCPYHSDLWLTTDLKIHTIELIDRFELQ